MSQRDVVLVCEGQPRGRDVRWLNLVVSTLAESYELAGNVRLVPGGSKADLGATVRGMREALRTPRVYAVRDRDFLLAELLGKDEGAGVYSFERHCLESYLLEPETVESALGVHGVAEKLRTLAEDRFWSDLARATLDAVGYELRRERLHLEEEIPASKPEVTRIVKAKLVAFLEDLAANSLDIDALVTSFEHDIVAGPLWTRVNGKELMKSLAAALGTSVLPSGDIEAELFKWCSKNGPPTPFVAEVKRILQGLPA
jgi:hypothetical protein